MKEADTRFHKINPALAAAQWGKTDGSYITNEYPITRGKVSKTVHYKPLLADYILVYKGVKLAVVEAKSDELSYAEGVPQAKDYAERLNIRFTYATNGDEIYEMDTLTGEERFIQQYPTPEELWQKTYGNLTNWEEKLLLEPLWSDGTKTPRYYQEVAIRKVMKAIAKGEKRILLTLATGTGKTFIAFQIAYLLFQTRWNLADSGTRPKILFLADRNVLANQARNDFGGFKDDAMVRIKPGTISKTGKVPTNGSVFFTIFQTFMCGEDGKEYFGQYPRDYFDLVIIDECHRGGANDESNWRGIMNYFSPAVQIGLTATPRVEQNANTYNYFTYHAYEYSLKQGIEDGYLTPYRHKNMISNIDNYIYSPDDDVESGVVDTTKVYTEEDFYKGNIKIRERDEARVSEFLKGIGETEKTLVFCATQAHAAEVRDMINRQRKIKGYCQRVTANDGADGEKFLQEFQDNEKIIPTVLTTSQKLSTGVDAKNIRHIVLMRPIESMIEFKQIIGRGTRIYDDKFYFTIWDFVGAYKKYSQPDWDGEPVCPKCGNNPCTCKPTHHKKDDDGEGNGNGGNGDEDVCPVCHNNPCTCDKPEKLVIKLSDGNKRNIRFINNVMFWGKDGKMISAEDFINELFGELPNFFSSREELHTLWSQPDTREGLLKKMEQAGYGKEVLKNIRKIIDAENCDLLDVLEYVAYNTTPIERSRRAEQLKGYMDKLEKEQRMFVEFMKMAYIRAGVDELGWEKLPQLMELHYGSMKRGIEVLGSPQEAQNLFKDFQKQLYISTIINEDGNPVINLNVHNHYHGTVDSNKGDKGFAYPQVDESNVIGMAAEENPSKLP